MAAVLGGGEVIERSVSLAGGKGHYLARVLPYRHRNNMVDGVILTFIDISGIVAAEAQQKVLAAELSHRVKNTLAVVSSIAERTLPDGETKTDLIARFHALGHTPRTCCLRAVGARRRSRRGHRGIGAAYDRRGRQHQRAADYAEAAGGAVSRFGDPRAVDQRRQTRRSVGARRPDRDRLEHLRRQRRRASP